MDLEHQGSGGLAGEERGEPLPGHAPAPGRQVEVQPQRIDLRRARVAVAGAEVVVEVEEDRAVQRRLDQLQRVRASQPGDDVAGEEIRFATVLRISGAKESLSGPG